MQRFDERAEMLQVHPRWSLAGRIAVSDGKDAGSGRFSWRQDGNSYVIEIRAPVSNQTWRLSGDGVQCQLEGTQPHPVPGIDPEELLEREVGWRIPVGAMRSWVRALPHDGALSHSSADAEGRPASFMQSGWSVDYARYDTADGIAMPVRIAATRPPYKVKVAVASWSLDE